MLALATEGIAYEVVPGVSAALAAAADSGRPLTRRGGGRSVSLTTAMTHLGTLQASRTADTEVFYMAGRQLPALSRKLVEAGWPGETPVSVVSRAGWPDVRLTDHQVATLAEAAAAHADRPAVVTVGAGAAPPLAKTPALERRQANDLDRPA
jgi:uroporphyrin-III C-methyltransferase